MEKSLVSIITPMYKGARFVSDTIASVIAQTYSNWEMIVIDDCSPDNGEGIAVVEKYMENEPRLKLIKLPKNKGCAGARNAGIKQANGGYLCLLDSDDFWDANFLEAQISLMKEKNAKVVFSSYRRVHEVTKEEVLRPIIVCEKLDYNRYLKTCEIGCLTVMYKSSELGKRYLNEDLKSVRDDAALWLSLLKDVDYFYGNKNILGSYRLVGGSATNNKLKIIKPHWNLLRNIEGLSFIRSSYYFTIWAFVGVYKYYLSKKL